MAAEAAWVLEADHVAGEKRATVAVAPTNVTRAELGDVPVARLRPEVQPACPGLQARILVRSGTARGPVAEAVRRSSGVRIYLEGFRVLPYGEPGDDWLSLDYQRGARGRGLSGQDGDPERDREAGLGRPGNRQVFGAVFLTERAAPELRMLVNREGFVPEAGFLAMRDLLATAIDLYVRESAKAREEPRRVRREQRREQARARDENRELSETFAKTLTIASGLEMEARRIGAGRLADQAASLRRELASTRQTADDLLTLPAITRVMASLGTQLAAFVHEVNAVLTLSRTLRDELQGLTPGRPELRHAMETAEELTRQLERQATYLVDIAAPDARRRRSRQPVRQVFDAATSLLRTVAEREEIEIRNDIRAESKTPPMFRAELVAVFSNILTNALKAAGHGGRIWAHAGDARADLPSRLRTRAPPSIPRRASGGSPSTRRRPKTPIRYLDRALVWASRSRARCSENTARRSSS